MNHHTCKCKECGQLGAMLPGWVCRVASCGAFNGETKTRVERCRACGDHRAYSVGTAAERRALELEVRNSRIRKCRKNTRMTIVEIAAIFGVSRSLVGEVINTEE